MIEITGPIDIGKKYVAQLVARRISGQYISFPKFLPEIGSEFPINTALLKILTSHPKFLEKNYHWWAHTYMAGMYEYKDFIDRALLEGPVVTTNYVTAFRTWMKTAGLDMPHFLSGFTADLPKPNTVYCLSGLGWEQPSSNIRVDFSPEFMLKVNKATLATCNTGARKIIMKDATHKFRHTVMNKAAAEITDDLESRFDININTLELFSSTHFTPKKYS